MSRTIFTILGGAGLVLALAAGMAAAKPALREVAYVREGLIAAGMAIELGDKCDAVSVRLIRGYSFLGSLKSHARSLGYTSDEIDAYVDDRAEKARLEDIARARLRDLGVVDGEAETYCTVARAEIAADTPVGHLLR
jgi:hypothetical protein